MKNLSLRSKILIPILVIVLVASVAAAVTVSMLVEKVINEQMELAQSDFQSYIEQEQVGYINSYMHLKNAMEEKALEEAALFSKLPVVEKAYRVALSGNIDDESDPRGQEARMMLRREIAPFIDGYKDRTGNSIFQLHFHLPNTHSLARLWRDGWQTKRDGNKVDISDDLTAFRDSVKKVNETKAPVTGIEVGSGGFVIRGMCPVTAADGTHLGSNEVISPFAPIIDDLAKSDRESFAVVMDKKFLGIATRMQDPEKYPVLGDRYVLCAATKTEAAKNLMETNLAILDRGIRERHSEIVENLSVAALPITDFNGAPVGVFVSMLNISEEAGALAARRAELSDSLRKFQMGIGIGALIALFIVSVIMSLVTRAITRPVLDLVSLLKQVADTRDITLRIRVKSGDEIGKLGRSLNAFLENLHQVLKGIMDHSDEVSAASTQMASLSEQMASSADSMCAQSRETVEHGNKVRHRVESAATAIQQISDGIHAMAGAVEQMTASLTEIAKSAGESAATSEEAEDFAKKSGRTAAELQSTSQGIDKVLAVIVDLAEQTKLLALNATIEAARAGAAGRGFSVVAGEVKELAGQTERSTDDIRRLVLGIQEHTSETASSIDRIGEIIVKVNELAQGIAAAVEQQSATIGEISQNLSSNASTTGEVSETTSDVAEIAKQMAGAVDGLSESAQTTAQAAGQVQVSSRDLSRLANDMVNTVKLFKL